MGKSIEDSVSDSAACTNEWCESVALQFDERDSMKLKNEFIWAVETP